MKKCRICKIDKDYSNYNKKKSSKDGYDYICKLCKKIESRKYYEKNIDKFVNKREINKLERKEYDKKRYENNKNNIIEQVKKYRINNADKIKEKHKEYYNTNKALINKKCKDRYEYIKNTEEFKQKKKQDYLDNREKYLDYYKDYYQNNKEKFKIYSTKSYNKNKERKNYIFSWRRILHSSIRRMGNKKEDLTIKLLGYSALELKNHIQNLFTTGMTWENYGEWHIDHIKPVTLFEKTTPPSIVNALNNLQPLWATTREIDGVIYQGNLNKNEYYILYSL
jgi:hypothetical protein